MLEIAQGGLAVPEDHRETAGGDAPEPREEYVAPSLTDLGSFEELTQLTTGPQADFEGMS